VASCQDKPTKAKNGRIRRAILNENFSLRHPSLVLKSFLAAKSKLESREEASVSAKEAWKGSGVNGGRAAMRVSEPVQFHAIMTQQKTVPEPRAKSWYRFRAAASGVELMLYDEIGSFGVSAKDFVNDLKRLGDDEPLTLRIHSTGGDIVEGNAIANSLKRRKGQVTTQIDGLAASIATVVALAGSPVRMAENGLFMIHDPWGATVGTSEELQKQADILDRIRETMISTYQAKTNLPRERIAQMTKDETWMTAAEAQELGFVDEITEPIKAAASITGDFDLTKFHNAPQKTFRGEHMTTTTTSSDKKTETEKERERISELHATANMVHKRDKIDVVEILHAAIKEGWSNDKFCKKILSSREYSAREGVVGEGPEDEDFAPRNSLGALVVNNPEFRALLEKNSGTFPQGTRLRIAVPRLSSLRGALTTSSLDFGIDQRPGVALLPQQRLYVSDLCQNIATDAKDVRYLRENSFTSAAATVAEGALKPAWNPDITKKDATIQKIAAYVKVGEETLTDFPQMAAMVNVRLPYQVQLVEEQQVLGGDGAGNNLTGILNTAGLQTQAKGVDTGLDALYKAITNVRKNAFLEPDGLVLHPTDFQTLRLAKDANSEYFGGGPFTGAYGTPAPENSGIAPMRYATLWGLPVAVTVSATQGTALVGSFKQAAIIYRRTGIMIEMTNSDQDDFIRNLITIRCEERVGLAVLYPLGFCQITGL
jgi:HK97 family phage major capsid protein